MSKTCRAVFLRFVGIALVCAGALHPNSASAQAWQGASGKIQSVTLSFSANAAFRIVLMNGANNALPSTCSYGFAYINGSDDNYQAKASALLSAYAQGKTVYINYIFANNFCQITDLTI